MRPTARMSALLLRRELTEGNLALVFAALLVAVACVTTVVMLTDRVEQALVQHAGDAVGGDLVAVSGEPIPAAWGERATAAGLETARLTDLPSVVRGGDETVLTEVRAVTGPYPLRGTLSVAERADGEPLMVDHGPEPGAVWLDRRALAQLGAEVGDTVEVGEAALIIDRVVVQEPGLGGDLFSLAPRLLMHEADLDATGLIGPGSRVRYRLLTAGEPGAVAEFHAWLEPLLAEGQRVERAEEARPELAAALDRGQRFLGLAALIGVFLSGIAVAMAARVFALRRSEGATILRCLGVPRQRVIGLYGLQLATVAMAGVLLGLFAGWVLQGGVAIVAAQVLGTALPAPGAAGLGAGLVVGIVGFLGFALPPVIALGYVPPLRVLKGGTAALPLPGWVIVALGALAIVALMAWQAGDARLFAWAGAGLLGTLAALTAVAWLAIRGSAVLARRMPTAFAFGLQGIRRRARASGVQVVGFGLVIMVLLLLWVVRGDLLAGWQTQIADEAPNHFIIGINPEQRDAVEGFLTEGLQRDVQLYPMVRARLLAMNGEPVDMEALTSDRARRFAQREFNLSWAGAPQEGNRITSGSWWSRDDQGRAWLSVTEEIAGSFGLGVGDEMTFRVEGEALTLEIRNIREVAWDTFNVNFFTVLPPGVLDPGAATYVTSVHVPADRRSVINELVEAYPNVTPIDVGAVIQQIRGLIERAALTVQFVFFFSVLAGLTVLAAAIATTQFERLREAAVLRAIGVSRTSLRQGLIAEFVALGFLAGLVGALGAGGAGILLDRALFDLGYWPTAWLLVLGPVAGALVIGPLGYLGTRRITRISPMTALKDYG